MPRHNFAPITGKFTRFSFNSALLENRLGDPAERDVLVHITKEGLDLISKGEKLDDYDREMKLVKLSDVKEASNGMAIKVKISRIYDVNTIERDGRTLEVLNMTGTLFELENPMEKLFLEYIENLTVLEVGENRLHSWNKTFFNNNANLKHLSIAKNGLDIMLTDEMLTDVFQNTNLDTLDLSGNTFLCSVASLCCKCCFLRCCINFV